MIIPFRVRSSKSISVFLLSLFALTSCETYPENGKWKGEVSIYEERHHATYRCPLELSIARTTTSVRVDSFDLACGSRSIHWSPSTYSRSGSELYKNGQRVGEIYPDGTVRLEIWDPSFTDHYPRRVSRLTISWSKIGDSLHFSLREDFEGDKLTIEGKLRATI